MVRVGGAFVAVAVALGLRVEPFFTGVLSGVGVGVRAGGVGRVGWTTITHPVVVNLAYPVSATARLEAETVVPCLVPPSSATQQPWHLGRASGLRRTLSILG